MCIHLNLMIFTKIIRGFIRALYFFLAGATSSYESRLINEKYLATDNDLCYRHISRIMNHYQWKKPITHEMMQSLSARIKLFLDKGHSNIRSCFWPARFKWLRKPGARVVRCWGDRREQWEKRSRRLEMNAFGKSVIELKGIACGEFAGL